MYYFMEFSCRFKYYSHVSEWKKRFGKVKEEEVPNFTESQVWKQFEVSLSELKGLICEDRT